jgi:hypothetical protein
MDQRVRAVVEQVAFEGARTVSFAGERFCVDDAAAGSAGPPETLQRLALALYPAYCAGGEIGSETRPSEADFLAGLMAKAARPGIWAADGFVHLLGSAAAEPYDQIARVRLYWNLTHPGAGPLVGEIEAALERRAIPFQFKCLAAPAAYTRSDAAVLYLARVHFPLARELVAGVRQRVAAWLRPSTPLFAKPLAPGLAVAEDPGDGSSFGLHRCGLLAEAIMEATRIDRPSADDVGRALEAAFRRRGLSLAAPHLGPGPANGYQLP